MNKINTKNIVKPSVIVFSVLLAISFLPVIQLWTNSLIILIFSELCLMAIFFFVFGWVFKKIATLKINNNYVFKKRKLANIIIFSALVAYFILMLFFIYPVVLWPDAGSIFNMATGQDFTTNWFRYDSINNHHPATYLFFEYLIIQLTSLFTSDQETMKIVLLFTQMLVFSAAITWSVNKVLVVSKNKVLWIFSIVILCNPITLNFCTLLLKDVLYAAFILFLVSELYEISMNKGNYFKKLSKCVWFGFLLILVVLFRHNGIFVFIATLICVLVLVDCKKRIILIGADVLIALILVNGPILYFSGVQPGHFSETVAVPLQQISNTYHKNGNFTEQEKTYFESILPQNEWEEKEPNISVDKLKFSNNFNDSVLDNDKLGFIYNWASLGIKNISLYFDAWIQHTINLWSPLYKTFENISDNVTNIKALLSSITDSLKTSVLVWIVLFSVFVNIYRRRMSLSLAAIPLIALLFTLLLAMPQLDIRYFYSFVLSLPIILCTILTDNKTVCKLNNEQ